MKFYFAPLEGVTGYIYRNVHYAFFKGDIDKYFAPFIVPNESKGFKSKEIKDLLPENNGGLVLVPQILTNNAMDFINTAKKIKQLGYDEINLNLGCPSGTVVSKGRGAGFLARTEALEAFLEEIFSQAVTKISVKTRLGKDDPQEFYELLRIFNQYPMEELIIHPRIQKDFYKNKPNLTVFKDALSLSKNPVCYNGDIFISEDYKDFIKSSSSVDTVMIGRGLMANPQLVRDITRGTRIEKELLKEFHNKVYEEYKRVLSGERNVLFKMKEIWFYMIQMFSDSEKYAKRIRKSERLADYDEVLSQLFRERELIDD